MHYRKNYQTVYDVICEAGQGQHLNAYELFVSLRDRRLNVSQTTVYRALERLVSLGLIDEVTAPGANHVAYELAGPTHAHFHCRICGVLRDLHLAVAETELLRKSDVADLHIEHTVMLFEGCCKTCG